MSDLVTLDQAARLLRIDRRTVQRLIKAGKLRRFKRVGDRKAYVEREAVRLLKLPQAG